MRTKTSQALLVSCFLLVLGASAAHAEIAASAEQTKPLAAGTAGACVHRPQRRRQRLRLRSRYA